MQRDILHKALVSITKDRTLDDLVKLFYNEFDAIEDFDKLCRGISAGKKISLLFNPHRLDTPTITSKTTVYEALKDDHLLDGFARMVCYDLSVGCSEPFYHSCIVFLFCLVSWFIDEYQVIFILDHHLL